jgi:superfamily II DNA or RNA helicase
MPEIRLSPSGRLSLSTEAVDSDSAVASLAQAFQADWREGLFLLAANGEVTGFSPSMRFWRTFAAALLTRVCHADAAENALLEEADIEPPDNGQFDSWIMTAPPMLGGEYLSPGLLADIWQGLGQWTTATVAADGGLAAFLEHRAPRWKQIGRVTFHLAENKNDESRPFAFMASFTTGMGAGGRVKHLPLRKALEQYSGAGNKQALLKLLTPVHAAAERLEWVKAMVESGEIYQPMAWSVPRAHAMLRSAEELEQCGLTVRLPDWWKKRPRPKVGVTIGESRRTVLNADAMLDFRVTLALGDTPLDREDLERLLSSPGGLVQFKGQWVEVDPERLKQALEHWKRIESTAADGSISFIQGMRLLAGASADLRDIPEEEETSQWAHVTAGQAMREMLQSLRSPSGDGVDLPPGLEATLRPYQEAGYAWLHLLTRLGLGACLADDMGLGKTVQVLALLLRLRQDAPGAPSLLVLPASLLGNWRSEAARFAPGLRLYFLHPAETERKDLDAMARDPEAGLQGCDVAVTTYSMLGRMPWLAEFPWRLVILDEAQAIRNHATAQSRAARRLRARARIALTGTPVENRLADLWSIFDFLNPGLLGTAKQFKDFAKGCEQRASDPFGPLRRLVSPYILRRLKTDRRVVADLPDKTEAVRYCFLTKEQARLYQGVVNELRASLEETEGIAKRGLILQSLMRLKQICNHPSQFSGDGDFAPEKGGKFARLAEICGELAERQERVLVFTQFREIMPALEEHLETVFGRPGLVLHGSTAVRKRKALVDGFQQEDGPPFFILSIKAGGTGLNLTAASHVIHFDRWWNPAVEDQATDRAFRIGQKRNVLVHKFVTRGTLEERIDKLINEKRELTRQLLSGGDEVKLTEMPDDELLQLVRLDLSSALST